MSVNYLNQATSFICSLIQNKISLLGSIMKNKMFNEKISDLYETRYCAQEDFSVVLYINKNLKIPEYPFSLDVNENSKQTDTLTRLHPKVVACGLNLFVISYNERNFMIEKYSESVENKIVLPSTFDERRDFSVCSFMQKIYLIGGHRNINVYSSTDSCICYDIKNKKWTYIASMIKSRQNSSCAVFKGKIVVTGGITKRHNFFCIKFDRSILLS